MASRSVPFLRPPPPPPPAAAPSRSPRFLLRHHRGDPRAREPRAGRRGQIRPRRPALPAAAAAPAPPSNPPRALLDWQELAQTAVIGLLFAFLVAKFISVVVAFKEDNLRITRSPPASSTPAPSPATTSPTDPPPRDDDGSSDGIGSGSDSNWEGVESTELDEEFSAASAFVAASAASGTSVPEEAQLRLYGLYKIATEGPCTAPQPSALKFKARAKW